jgi:hypothetical protein
MKGVLSKVQHNSIIIQLVCSLPESAAQSTAKSASHQRYTIAAPHASGPNEPNGSYIDVLSHSPSLGPRESREPAESGQKLSNNKGGHIQHTGCCRLKTRRAQPRDQVAGMPAAALIKAAFLQTLTPALSKFVAANKGGKH